MPPPLLPGKPVMPAPLNHCLHGPSECLSPTAQADFARVGSLAAPRRWRPPARRRDPFLATRRTAARSRAIGCTDLARAAAHDMDLLCGIRALGRRRSDLRIHLDALPGAVRRPRGLR